MRRPGEVHLRDQGGGAGVRRHADPDHGPVALRVANQCCNAWQRGRPTVPNRGRMGMRNAQRLAPRLNSPWRTMPWACTVNAPRGSHDSTRSASGGGQAGDTRPPRVWNAQASTCANRAGRIRPAILLGLVAHGPNRRISNTRSAVRRLAPLSTDQAGLGLGLTTTRQTRRRAPSEQTTARGR